MSWNYRAMEYGTPRGLVLGVFSVYYDDTPQGRVARSCSVRPAFSETVPLGDGRGGLAALLRAVADEIRGMPPTPEGQVESVGGHKYSIVSFERPGGTFYGLYRDPVAALGGNPSPEGATLMDGWYDEDEGGVDAILRTLDRMIAGVEGHPALAYDDF